MRPRKDARPPLTQDDPKRRKGVLTMAQVEGRRQWDNVWKRAGEQRLANAGIHLGCCCAKRGECPTSSACCVGPTKLNRLSQQRQGRQWETSVAVNRSNTQQETVPQEGRNQQTGHSGGTCNDENPVGFSQFFPREGDCFVKGRFVGVPCQLSKYRVPVTGNALRCQRL